MNHRIVLLGCLILAAPIAAQERSEPIVLGETYVIESRVLDESRRVYVATPDSYDQEAQRYGVLYILDGEGQFLHAVASAHFLAGFANQMIPQLLVVGIGNTNRMRDMTPAAEARENEFLQQGGADRFLRFIVEELKPWVGERYRTTDYSALIGHSLGGLFVMHALVTEPGAFDGFVAIDPSLNWNNQALLQEAEVFLGGDPDLNASLFLSVSSAEGPELDGVLGLTGLLDSRRPDGLRWTLVSIVAESHDSIPLPGVYEGLQWTFSSWDVEDQAEAMFSDAPGEEILEAIDDLYRTSGEEFGQERATPYLVFESLLGYLAQSDRLDEAAELTLQHSDRYPLPLVPNVIAGIAQMFVDSGNEEAAIDYLTAVLEIYPGNVTATDALIDIGVDPGIE